MFRKISTTWDLMFGAWQILRTHKLVLVLPLFSGIACAIVSGTYLWFLPSSLTKPNYLALFLLYFCCYTIMSFFNGAVMAWALLRLKGLEADVGDGLDFAIKRLPLILKWALLQATVGLLLHILEERAGRYGKIIIAILGITWSSTGYLAVPALIAKGLGPMEALSFSASLLKKTWGEQLIASFSFGSLSSMASTPFVILLLIGMVLQSIPLIAIAIFGFISVALIMSALKSIFLASLYWYANKGEAQWFDPEKLNSSLQPKLAIQPDSLSNAG